MSRRTANANKAIAARWAEEQQLVNEGKGTRDWTPEQQRDILDRGKAYDDIGKAFEGHHMKSVEKYPEYQGDLDNIQFLSRPEHSAAHSSNFQNSTNGYFDPFTGETKDFSENKYKPCEIIELSNPVSLKNESLNIASDSVDATLEEEQGNPSPKTVNTPQVAPPEETSTSSATAQSSASASSKTEPIKSGFKEGIKRAAKAIKEFSAKHPVITEIAKDVGIAAVYYIIDRSASRGGSGGNRNNSPSKPSNTANKSAVESLFSVNDISNVNSALNEGSGKGIPKAPHNASGYTRMRNGKLEHVRGYSTGKSKSE